MQEHALKLSRKEHKGWRNCRLKHTVYFCPQYLEHGMFCKILHTEGV
jgi:hypothetical protein